MARATLDRAVTDGRVLPIRALKINEVLDEALARTPTSSAVQPAYQRDV